MDKMKILLGAAVAVVLSGCVMFGSGNECDLVRKISEEHKVLSVEDG